MPLVWVDPIDVGVEANVLLLLLIMFCWLFLSASTTSYVVVPLRDVDDLSEPNDKS